MDIETQGRERAKSQRDRETRTNIQIDRETLRRGYRNTDRHTYRDTMIWGDRYTERQRETSIQRERERDRETDTRIQRGIESDIQGERDSERRRYRGTDS